MDDVVIEANAGMLGRVLRFLNSDNREWKISWLLFVFSGGFEGKIVYVGGRIWILRVNENKSKVIKSNSRVNGRRMNFALNGELFEEVECFEYLGSNISVDRGIETGEV